MYTCPVGRDSGRTALFSRQQRNRITTAQRELYDSRDVRQTRERSTRNVRFDIKIGRPHTRTCYPANDLAHLNSQHGNNARARDVSADAKIESTIFNRALVCVREEIIAYLLPVRMRDVVPREIFPILSVSRKVFDENLYLLVRGRLPEISRPRSGFPITLRYCIANI